MLKLVLLSAVGALGQSDHWKPVNSPTFSALSEAISIAFTADGSTGYVGGGQNGVGVEILKTTDFGQTWSPVWPDPSTKDKFNLFIAAAVKSENEAIVTGALFNTYTVDGNHFNTSKNEFLDPSQDAGVTPGGLYAIVIAGAKAQGVATSKTGEKWVTHQLAGPDVNLTIYPPRYGSYPSDTVWYLTTGNFPTSNDKLQHLTHKVAHDPALTRARLTASSLEQPDAEFGATPVPCTVDPTNCFSTGLFKSSDAGKSWALTWSDLSNNIYPNGIDCFTEDHCIAVVEGDTCQILVTFDGAKTWTVANKDTDPACSLTTVDMISDTEAWVGGGYLSKRKFAGRFWHTLDGGKTWVLEEVPGLYILDIDMPSDKTGYACGLTAQSGVGLLKYVPQAQ